MRGKAAAGGVFYSCRRITPAYAGKSFPSGLFYAHNRDHPRVCGEKCSSCWVRCLTSGSPPRMRGKEAKLTNRKWKGRITPAYAGKSDNTLKNKQKQWDHPRVCGEKLVLFRLAAWLLGSPPRMRGKECLDAFWCLLSRITPAYAGKRLFDLVSKNVKKDHPRVCGEKVHTDCKKH